MTKTLGDLLKDVKKSIIDEVDKKDPIVALDKNEDGLVITKSSGQQFIIDLSHFNVDMSNVAKGEKGDKGEQGERGLSIKGDRGEPGRAGNSITDVRFDQRGHLIIETDDKTYDLGLLRSGGGTNTIVQQGDGAVQLSGDITGTTNTSGVTNTILQPSENVFDVISQAPTYAYPEFTEFSIAFPANKYEIGDTIPNGIYSIEFGLNNPDNLESDNFILRDKTNDVTLAPNINFSPYSFNTEGFSFTLDTPSYYEFELIGTNSKGELFNKVFFLPFVDRYYYGESSQDTMLSPSSDLLNSQLTEVEKLEYTDFSFNSGAGLYKWIYIPERFGDDYFFEDPGTGIQFLMEQGDDIIFSNTYGILTTYKVYRSINRIAGEIKLRVY